MNEFFAGSVYFGVLLSLGTYLLGIWLKEKTGIKMLNPLLTAVVLTIAVLLALKVDYDTYYAGAKYLSYLLTPATICLAVPLYEQFEKLKKNAKAILAGILAGVLTGVFAGNIGGLVKGANLNNDHFVLTVEGNLHVCDGLA